MIKKNWQIGPYQNLKCLFTYRHHKEEKRKSKAHTEEKLFVFLTKDLHVL